ncbi:MAG: PEP-CTERM sorting domain-containing protein [Planctomycetota bacterium]
MTIPEPATIALLGLGSLALLKKRKLRGAPFCKTIAK